MIKSCKHCKSANIKHDEYTLWCADCWYILSHNPKLWQKKSTPKNSKNSLKGKTEDAFIASKNSLASEPM